MEIQLIHPTTDYHMKQVIDFLWAKTPKQKAKLHTDDRIYAGNDSILEIPEWYAFCTAPRSVAMQIETTKKKNGCYLWMASARPDRDSKAAQEYSRDQEVKFVFKFTARGIIEISHYRMCMKAEDPTRRFMYLLQKALLEYGEGGACREAVLVARQMMPMCAYRNGLCTETQSCMDPQKYPFPMLAKGRNVVLFE